ncbi:MAG TPA: hypothetical protein DCP92_24935 [Nitrospiraceae bacterium]|nr:hypothetical protein [Nitrospiraceae bacterium]
MQTSEYIAELSKCVRCGSCKAFCPTYDEDLTEPMSARGRLTLLRALLNRQIEPSPALNDRVFSCILCGACENLCPPRLDITEAMYHGRNFLKDFDRRRKYLRLITRFSLKKPMLGYRVAKMLQHAASPYLLKKGLIPFRLPILSHPLRDDQQVYKPEKKIGRVAIFTGCSINFLLPHLGLSLIRVLLRLGYEVVLPRGEVCCGAPLRGLGLEKEASEMARKNHRIFSKLNTDAIVSLCPTCIVSLKVHYPKMINGALADVLDISSFLSDKLGYGQPHPLSSFTSVTYHDPCHLRYSLGVRHQPRQLIRQSGAEFIEAEGEGCCGFGGFFSLQYREISRNLLKKRIDAYTVTDARDIITACPGCMLQLSSGSKERQVFHIIELIEDAIY